MTSTKNTIWRAPTTVLVYMNIIHAEGVLSKEMNKFRLRSPVTRSVRMGLGARQIYISVRL